MAATTTFVATTKAFDPVSLSAVALAQVFGCWLAWLLVALVGLLCGFGLPGVGCLVFSSGFL